VRYIIFAWERGNCGGLLQGHAGNDAHRGEQEAHHPSPEGTPPAAVVGLLFAVFMTADFGTLFAVFMTAAFGALFAVFMTIVVAASATTADIF
jgi:hypothetical protein